jgi:hypothetical protein
MRSAILIVLLLLAACTLPRKAEERGCRRADQLMAKAVMKCPTLLNAQVKVDTVVVYTEAKAGAGETTYSQQQMDSLFLICSDVVERYQDYIKRADQIDSGHVAYYTQKLRAKVCAFEPITVAENELLLKIWAENGKVRYWYNVLPQKTTKVISTPTRTIAAQAPCAPVGVSSGWRTAFFIQLLLLVIVLLLGRLLLKAPLQHDPEA